MSLGSCLNFLHIELTTSYDTITVLTLFKMFPLNLLSVEFLNINLPPCKEIVCVTETEKIFF